MLDFIILFFLTKKIGALAAQKGLPIGRWKMHLIIAWLGAEFFGVLIGAVIFGIDNLMSCLILAFGCAITAYLLLHNYLVKLPNNIDENDIGRL